MNNQIYIHYYLVMLLVFSVLVIDNRMFRIKDWIYYPSTAAALIINYQHSGQAGLYDALLGAFFPVVLLFIFVVLGILEKADMKLFSAIGAIMGFNFIVFTIFYSLLVQVIKTLIIWRIRGSIKERISYYFNHLKSCWTSRALLPYYGYDYTEERSKIPFTFAIVFGVLIKIIY